MTLTNVRTLSALNKASLEVKVYIYYLIIKL